ncbi:MAG: hypothetical protein IPJ77_17975 [Planctomycetes bacterium]|nr:hypothetical protein [Planctomycetota bacterium]
MTDRAEPKDAAEHGSALPPRDRAEARACCAPGTSCGPSFVPAPSALDRRGFLTLAGLSSAALAARATFVAPFAGPFEPDDFPIPRDKQLDPAWVASLTARGEPTVYTSEKGELDWIGMPIGGIGCGQVYLGGDGKLWLWDIFNAPVEEEFRSGQGPHYKTPLARRSSFEQGFHLFAKAGARTWSRSIDRDGFRSIRFRGEYPEAFVEYSDADVPFRVTLEAFSPFVPLDAEESSLPAIVCEYVVENTGKEPLEIELLGWIENTVAPITLPRIDGRRYMNSHRHDGFTVLEGGCTPPAKPTSRRPDLPFEDFEREDWGPWTATGTAFGTGPQKVADLPQYMGPVDAHGERTANTHETRHGEDVAGGDAHTGTLTSPSFTIRRPFISFRIGGGRHPGDTCVNLIVDGAVVATATGLDSNRMRLEHFDVRPWSGKEGRLEIVDRSPSGWGNLGVDDIVFLDSPRTDVGDLSDAPDYGSIALAHFTPTGGAHVAASFGREGIRPPSKTDPDAEVGSSASVADARPVLGGLSGTATLSPGAKATFTFVVAWHVRGLPWDALDFIPDVRKLRRHYAGRFVNAVDVVNHVFERRDYLFESTRAWRATWYDRSTLPHWFLERTFASLSTVATATCLRFSNGRFYGWEGTYCCAGTCTHVWQYAQGLARVFPELERDLRERTDFGTSFHADSGLVDYRGEAARSLAIDGQCGTIVRAWREHQMAKDGAFLARIWPRVKKSMELVLARDTNQDGLLDGEQYNTLDASWWGEIAWTSSLYVAALRASEAMAGERGDAEFAARCRTLADRGSKALVARLFDGEYFVQKLDPAHPEANGTGKGCHIDQLLGQSFAHQVGLPRVVPANEARSALAALWRYNFAPDVGPYRARFDSTIQGGRWYAMPGEGGLVMCTWPKGGHESATGKGNEAWAAGYFNECMTGFEHQVASHMLWEGMRVEGLAVERAIHDRYHASKRNPWNEVECSDHYARAMASYGVYLAACGFELHGPNAHLGFAPRIAPDDFRSAFTTPEGWGTYAQSRDAKGLVARYAPAYGRMWLKTLAFEVRAGLRVTSVSAAYVDALPAQEGEHAASFVQDGTRVVVALKARVDVTPGQEFVVTLA